MAPRRKSRKASKQDKAFVALLGAIFTAVFTILGFFFRGLSKMLNAKQTTSSPTKPMPPSTKRSGTPAKPTAPVRTSSATSTQSTGKWIAPGYTIAVQGINIPGGLIYAGSTLKTATGQEDACLINPSLPIAFRSQPVALDGYWPNYSALNPQARRTYLEWLASGRQDPNTDIGYVFLYFYGLERRAVYDVAIDMSARADYPLLANELTRLLVIYGHRSKSFKRYAEKLLDWVTFSNDKKTYTSASLTKVSGSLMQIKYALGQASMDGVAIPAKLAFEWIQHEAELFPTRTAATRCPAQFQSVFETRYRERFGSGMVLKPNKTRLQFTYKPASASHNMADISMRYPDIPDVSVQRQTVTDLQDVIESATASIDPYSRYLAKNPEGQNDLEALVLLPPYLWPTQMRQAVHAIKRSVLKAPTTMTYAQLMQDLGSSTGLNADKAKALALSLEVLNIGMEPDVLSAMKLPRLDDHMVLFDLPVSPDPSRENASYKAGFLTVQLAAAVASADGECSPGEYTFVAQQIERWSHLPMNHRKRLTALWKIRSVAPIKLQTIVKQMEGLSAATKMVILDFAELLLQKDGKVSAQEVTFLGKVYTALGLDTAEYLAKHQALLSQPKPKATAKVAVPKTVKKPFQLDPLKIAALQDETAELNGLLTTIFESETPVEAPPIVETLLPPVKQPLVQLDKDRIAALQQDTKLVDNLLANIFTDNIPAAVESLDPVEQSDENEPLPEHEGGTLVAPILPGLDEAHNALAKFVLEHTPCSRADLQNVANDLDLMLDGALERLNDACFDAYDAPFTEGDDPIEINLEIKDKL